MDKELVDKVLKQYINYCDYITIYEKFDDIFKDRKVNLQQKKNFVDTVDKMLITLNDDELFIITQLYNLELEPYLRKWTPGSVPDEEIWSDDKANMQRRKYFDVKNDVFEKLTELFNMIGG